MRQLLLILTISASPLLADNPKLPLPPDQRRALAKVYSAKTDSGVYYLRLGDLEYFIMANGSHRDIKIGHASPTPVDVSEAELDRLLVKAVREKFKRVCELLR